MKEFMLLASLLSLVSASSMANFVPGRVDVVATCTNVGPDHGYTAVVTQVEGQAGMTLTVAEMTVAGFKTIETLAVNEVRVGNSINFVDTTADGELAKLAIGTIASLNDSLPGVLTLNGRAGRINESLGCHFPVHIL